MRMTLEVITGKISNISTNLITMIDLEGNTIYNDMILSNKI